MAMRHVLRPGTRCGVDLPVEWTRGATSSRLAVLSTLAAAAIVAASDGAAAAELGPESSATNAILAVAHRPGGRDPATGATAPSLRSSGGRAALPASLISLPGEMSAKARVAFWLASDKVATRTSCAGLFAGLSASGVATLTGSEYRAASGASPREHCGDGVAAYTVVGSRRVTLCPEFATLSTTQEARILIHEALHSAGLGEWPAYPHALMSEEINRMVAGKCGV
jgi:hypothetical protein